MKDIINRVYEKKLTDGTIERIVSEHFDKMIFRYLPKSNVVEWRSEEGCGGEVEAYNASSD